MKVTNSGQTHWEECWEDSGHHACAIAKISELQVLLATKFEEYDAAIERALKENRQLRQQLAQTTQRAERAEVQLHLRGWCDDPGELAAVKAERDQLRQQLAAENAEADYEALVEQPWTEAVDSTSDNAILSDVEGEKQER